MVWPGLDYHSHICAATIDAMIDSAIDRGVREFGISEHIFQLDEGLPIFPEVQSEGVCFSRQRYIETVRGHAERSSLDLRLGLEVDFVPDRMARVADVLSGVEWDYLIGSVHEIDGVDLFAYTPVDTSDGERLWRRYYALSLEAVESGMFDVLAHPVRNMILNPHVPEDISDMVLALAESAARHGVALELNGEDTRRWPQMVGLLAASAARAGAMMSLGSDAHQPATVAQALQVACEIASAAGHLGIVSFQRRDRCLVPFR